MKPDQLKIAVFIDFDNIEIGAKTTLGQHFDVGAVLETLRERGEIVSKSAYGDWTRAGDYGRTMSQHAIHMVQRSLTPGGDKNGADINLALDALEMAFTHNHINAFVIVSGDSDFISLVEKLKQYDRKVFVVGGRAFTSVVMQKNCTEFIAYENLVGRGRTADRSRATGDTNLGQAMPLVRRALKLLADREVVPQLGLLKSTLLQLDSAFSEREYGASSFRDFVQKLSKAGYVSLKGSDRSLHVELSEGAGDGAPAQKPSKAEPAEASPAPAVATPAAAEPPDTGSSGEASLLQAEGHRIIQQAFLGAASPPRWPLYVRQAKQIVRAIDPAFDERKYGFSGMVEALRYGQREGLFRLDRDRMGVVRVYAGPAYQRQAPQGVAPDEPVLSLEPVPQDAPYLPPTSGDQPPSSTMTTDALSDVTGMEAAARGAEGPEAAAAAPVAEGRTARGRGRKPSAAAKERKAKTGGSAAPRKRGSAASARTRKKTAATAE